MVRPYVKVGSTFEPLIPGVNDHGDLLDNALGDPHPQYQDVPRGDARYVNKTGDMMTGPLEVRGVSGMVLSDTAPRVRLRPNRNSQFGLRAENPSNSAVLMPVEGARPSQDEHVTDPYYARLYRQMLVSGPHGGVNGWGGSGYYGVNVQAWTPMPGGAVASAARWEPGRYKVGCATYLAITAATQAHNTMYLGIYLAWGDGGGIAWRNNCAIRDFRFTVMAQGNRGYTMGVAEGWIENRPGQTLKYCGASYAEAGGATFQFGNNYRVWHEFYPYNGTELGLGSGWTAWG